MSLPTEPRNPVPHNRLGALLLAQKEVLMRQWTARVLADPEVPEANRLTEPELRDHIPTFIDELAAKMTGHAFSPPPAEVGSGESVGRSLGANGTATAHARQRFAQRYATSAALRELSHFRAVVIELCFREAIVLRHDTAQLLHAAIDGAMGKAATEIERNGQSALREEVAVRERFMAILTHDLRTPLQAVGMATHLLLEQDPTDGQASYLRRIVRSAQRAERMIEDMLDLARARLGGGLSINAESTDAHEICRRVIEEAQLANPKRRLSFVPEGNGQGLFDPGRVAQVASNLVSNALVYSPEGSVVTVASRGLEADRVTIEVHNEGSPIPAEELSTLFEPFRRGMHGAGASKGLGLGLFIARELALCHGGTLDVASSPERGTVFTLVLPRLASLEAARTKG